MATELNEIRVITTRLHSHLMEWSDMPLQNDLLYLFDQLQNLHEVLDSFDAPGKGGNTTLVFRIRELFLDYRNKVERQASIIEDLQANIKHQRSYIEALEATISELGGTP